MTATRVIYALADPRTGAPRYVGVTEDARTRLCVHVCTARHAVSRGRSSPLYTWILDVLAANLRPTIQIVRAVDGDKAAGLVAEREEIARFLAAGADLLNRRSTGRQKNPIQHAYRERHRAMLDVPAPDLDAIDRPIPHVVTDEGIAALAAFEAPIPYVPAGWPPGPPWHLAVDSKGATHGGLYVDCAACRAHVVAHPDVRVPAVTLAPASPEGPLGGIDGRRG